MHVALPPSASWLACVSLLAVRVTCAAPDDGASSTGRTGGAPAAGAEEIRPCTILVPDGGVAGHYQTNLWPEGKIYYTFASDVSQENKKRVFDAMNELESVCGVRFLLHVPGGSGNYILFRNGSSNSSYVGMKGGQQQINLFNWNVHYIIVHEIMHALGFQHEHQRSDRDLYVTVNPSKVQSGHLHNFTLYEGVLEGQCPTTFGSYDFDSVMHYDACGFSICGALCPLDYDNCATITVNEPWHAEWQSAIGQIDHLSAGDVATLQTLYPRPFLDEVIRYESGLYVPSQPVEEGIFSYALDANDETLVAGAPGDQSLLTIDAAYVLKASTGQMQHVLTASDLARGARFGHSVAIDRHDGADVPYVLVGAPPYGFIAFGDLGSAYVFDSGTGEEITKLTASDAEYGKIFGHAVAIHNFRAIVGAPYAVFDVFPLHDWGAAYVFDPYKGTQIAKLLPADTQGTYAGFGFSADIFDLTAIVGSPGDNHAGFSSGSAYLFEAIEGGGQRFKLTASDAHPSQRFGISVALVANTVLVGAPGDNGAGANSGAAYVFDADTGEQRFKLVPVHRVPGQSFGCSVAIRGTIGIVGASGNDHLSPSGAAYLFDLVTGRQLLKFDACVGEADDGVGFSVALSAAGAFVGAHWREAAGFQSPIEAAGAIFVFGTSVSGTPPIPGDIDDDGDVDGADLGLLLGAWGPCARCPADLDGDGVVDGADLGLLLGAWTG